MIRAAVHAGVKVVVAATSNCVLGHSLRISGKPFPFHYLGKFRPDLVDKVRELPERASFISTERAAKAFGWKPENSWTRFR